MAERFKILHVDPERGWGGGEVQVMGLTTYLCHSGHRSEVACDPGGELSKRLQGQGFPWLPLRICNHVDIRAAWRLRHLVRTGEYDIVHFHTARAHALSLWLGKGWAKRVVTRRMDYPLSHGLYTRLLYGQGVDGLIAISQGVKAAMCAGGAPRERIRVIYSGIQMPQFSLPIQVGKEMRQAYQIHEGEKVVVVVASLEERKGHRFLLQAAALLKEQGCRLRYLLCGQGSLRPALEREVRDLSLSAEVTFVGFCDDVPWLLAGSDIFVHPPLWEGLGVVVLEAMAAGLPVVASRVGGIPEVVEDQITGLLCPAGDGEALAAAVSTLLNDPDRARAMGELGRRRVQERFSVEAMARSNEAFYREICGDVGRGA